MWVKDLPKWSIHYCAKIVVCQNDVPIFLVPSVHMLQCAKMYMKLELEFGSITAKIWSAFSLTWNPIELHVVINFKHTWEQLSKGPFLLTVRLSIYLHRLMNRPINCLPAFLCVSESADIDSRMLSAKRDCIYTGGPNATSICS